MIERTSETQERWQVLRQLIREGESSTQEELCQSLRQNNFDVTQSTVSRDLRRIGAIKTTNEKNEIIYRLPEDHRALTTSQLMDLTGLVREIESNETMIVVHTSPGSASLVAARLDSLREPLGILGTISGDDAIFVAPKSNKKISVVVKKIKEEFI